MDLRQLFATNLRRLRSAARQSKIGIRLGFLISIYRCSKRDIRMTSGPQTSEIFLLCAVLIGWRLLERSVDLTLYDHADCHFPVIFEKRIVALELHHFRR
jgi:hypothetical protein